MSPADEIELFGDWAKRASSEELYRSMARCLTFAVLFCRELQRRGDQVPFDLDAFQAWLESLGERAQ
ncbi:MAG TPA: hypothetical protein VG651_00355 [Stellaceae bacterium]|nr:hypothetical protein [Stellaceae bacterium]